jgi:phytanoyl-CoA hydroxylase
MIDRQRYNQDGFLLLRSFFDKAEIKRLREEAKRVFEAQLKRHGLDAEDLAIEANFNKALFKLFETDFQEVANCGKQVQHLISLHRLGTDPRIVELLTALGLTFPCISARPVLFFNSRHVAKKEEYWRLGAHQDWRSSQGSLDAVTIWAPLVDIDKSLGALEVVPASHKWGLLESEGVSYYGKISEDVKTSDFLPIEVEAGDALVFSSFLVHRSGTNSTESIRWSCHFRYNNLSERTFIDRGYPHPFIYKPQEGLITPQFPKKELLARVFVDDVAMNA